MLRLATSLEDLIVVVERTGAYHRVIQRAFNNGGFEVRIIHPFATKQYRQPADPRNKTVDSDLAAIHCAAVNGFGLLEHEPKLANRRLRAAIMIIADNLLKCNEHFRLLAAGWRLKGKDARDIHVKIAGRFDRIAYHMVAGRQVFQHPSACRRDYILGKLIKFCTEHEIAGEELERILHAAIGQLPPEPREEEAIPLAEKLARARKQRGAGPRSLGEILPEVLAKLGVGLVRSNESGESDLTERPS